MNCLILAGSCLTFASAWLMWRDVDTSLLAVAGYCFWNVIQIEWRAWREKRW